MPRPPLAPQARQAVTVGVAAALLPLAAAPAIANESVGSAASGFSATNAVSPARAATTLAFSAPATARTGTVRVGVRLRADGRPVKDGYVRLERSTRSGWAYAGRLLTDRAGLSHGSVRVAGTTRLRAAYTGNQTRTAAASAARTVRAAVAGPALLRTGAGQGVLTEAARHVGKPYVYGAVGPAAFDCSGFTRYVYGRLGIALPRTSGAQQAAATRVAKSAARPGDLVFIQDVVGHVGIYAGNGQMYDAPRSGKNVSLRSIWTPNYTVGRVL